MSEYMSMLQSSWSQLMDNFSFSAVFATISTIVLQYSGADIEAVVLWLVFSTIDCLLGVFRAVMWKEFDAHKLHRWAWKIGTQLIIIMLFVMMMRLVRIASGLELAITNWLLCFFAFFDFSTCIDKLVSMNVPLPKALLKLLSVFRRVFARRLAGAVGATDEDAEKLADAMKTTPAKKASRKRAKPAE